MTTPLDPFGWTGQNLNGKYHVDRVVGEGGFGVVYRAMHRGLGEPVAIKCLKMPTSLAGEERARFEQSFLDEGRLLHRLSKAHAGIAQALDMGTAVSPSGVWTPFMVLEWLEGCSLQEELEDKRELGDAALPIREALDMIAPALDALAVAHHQGVAHRDLKPANLFLAQVGGRTMLKVLDFGIAKVLAQTVTLTRAFEETGASIKAFTPQYGAPEQFDPSRGATGPWTDVFALGLIFVELLTGRPALDGLDTIQLFVASANPQARPTPKKRGAQVPDALDRVLEKALAVNPRDRYLNAAELRDDLLSAVHGSLDTKRVLRGPATGTELAPGPPPGAMQDTSGLAHTPAAAREQEASTTSPQVGPVPPAPGPAQKQRVPVALVGLLVALPVFVAGLGAAAWWGFGLLAEGSDPPVSAPPSAAAATPASAPAADPGPAAASDMVRVPAGSFTMGRKTASASERPEHRVTFSRGFYIDRTEVTAAQYAACVAAGACSSAGLHGPDIATTDVGSRGTLCNSFQPTRSSHPINCVDRLQAEAYCRYAGKRLPTEAEWEYAARGPSNRRFPWGNEVPSCALIVIERAGAGVCRDGTTGTAAVGSYPANASPFGALDMAGNVREWVADGFDEKAYRRGEVTDPEVQWKAGSRGIVRGGGWESPLGDASAWRRVSLDPATGDLSTGIRCVGDAR